MRFRSWRLGCCLAPMLLFCACDSSDDDGGSNSNHAWNANGNNSQTNQNQSSNQNTNSGGSCAGTATTCDAIPVGSCSPQSGCMADTACGGVVVPCSDHSGFGYACDNLDGCHYVNGCAGSAYLCHTYSSSYNCTSQDGCNWSSYNNECSGYAKSCSSIYSGCTHQDGCYITSDCLGTSTPCDQISTADCGQQEGCSSVSTCTGLPTACTALTTEAACAAQIGCAWSP
jgi:hypothetical protein